MFQRTSNTCWKMSSNINEGIKAVLFFNWKDFTRTKSTKSTKRMQAIFLLLDVSYEHKKHKKHKNHKKHKTSNNKFLPLRCFYVHKNAFFFVSHTKKYQKHIKSIKRKISDLFPLRCFLSAWKCCVFFVFVRLYAFLSFMCVWNLFV